MTEYKYFIVEKSDMDAIVSVKINRPHKMNAFSEALTDELEKVIHDIEQNPNVKVMILGTTSKEFFSAGADIEWFAALSGEDAVKVSQRVHEVFGLLEKLPFPVLSVVKGMCFTAGMELIYCSDLIFCTPDAQFGQLEVRYGITPGAGGTQRLVRLVGPLKAREIIYSGATIPAEEAHRIGLVNYIYSQEEIDEKVMQFAKILLKNSSRAIKECKFLIQQAIYENPEGFKREEVVFGEDFASLEPKHRLGKIIETIKKKK